MIHDGVTSHSRAVENDQTKNLAALLRDAQAGNQERLQLLCKELEKYLRGYFWKKFQDNVIVDDLCQETYIRFLKNLSTIREPMKLRGFVAKVALHVSQDYFKQKYRMKEERLESYYSEEKKESHLKIKTDSNQEDENLLVKLDLEKALSQLSDKSREILTMKSQGYNYEEIAAKKDLTVSGVKMQVKRSLEQLRLILNV